MGKKRIVGNDRAVMFLVVAARKYWRYYSPVYKDVKKQGICNMCAKYVGDVEVDHEPPLGSRPRRVDQTFVDWYERLMNGPQYGLCKKHHKQKTKEERCKKKKAV